MNDSDKSMLKQHIQDEIDQLAKQITSMESLSPSIPDEDEHVRSEARQAQAVDKTALSNAWQRLNALQQTLENIDDENYGICAVCGENIPLGRLKILPEANLCVKHAEEES
jgi:DnaK suppressor protein